jgi:hypothetical protein
MRIIQFFKSLHFLFSVIAVLIALLICLGNGYYRSKTLIVNVPVVEPDLGPSKIKYLLVQKSQYLEPTGKELYDSLRFKQRFDVKTSILNSSEKPVSPFLKTTQGEKNLKEQDLNLGKGWNVSFVESILPEEQNYKKQKFYRIRVATVKSPDQASEIWAVIKSKNPIVFENCKFIVDKKSLSDGSIVYCIALGEYRHREDTYAMVSRLNSVGQNAYVYEIFK